MFIVALHDIACVLYYLSYSFFCLFFEAGFHFLALTGLKLDLNTKLAWTLYSFLVSVSLVLSLWVCAIMPVYRCVFCVHDVEDWT